MALDAATITMLLAQLGAIALGTFLIGHILGSIVGKAASRGGSLSAAPVQRLTKLSVWLAGLTFAAEYFGLPVDVLLVLIALAGSALLIANKDALQNVASRYFSGNYLQFRVGDKIRVREYAGKIIEFNPITTMLVTDNEEIVSIPNSILLREIVVNATPYAGRDITIPVTIDKDVDLPTFEKQLLLKCNKLRLHLDDSLPPRIGIKAKGEKTTQLELMVRVRSPEKRDRITRELNTRVQDTLETVGRKKTPESRQEIPLQETFSPSAKASQ